MSAKQILITGAAGFIGSALASKVMTTTNWRVTVFDALTYAGNPSNLEAISSDPRFRFIRGDIRNRAAVRAAFKETMPSIVFHLAAESHVDRSIDAVDDFISTNVVGTQILLDEARLLHSQNPSFRFVHISTDEVFGDLEPNDPAFTETSPYKPSSPYAASKAASDHLVRAAHRTHGLPILISNCSNNYGPRQFPEKLIPLMIIKALEGKKFPLYGDGSHRRDWLHVDDHAEALIAIAQHGQPGETFCIGGGHEASNLEVVRMIHRLVADLTSLPSQPFEKQVDYVADRPGHDRRYSICSKKAETILGWQPKNGFEAGVAETVKWYLENPVWWEDIRSGRYRGDRLGLGLGPGLEPELAKESDK